jgi:hypothetical protein
LVSPAYFADLPAVAGNLPQAQANQWLRLGGAGDTR